VVVVMCAMAMCGGGVVWCRVWFFSGDGRCQLLVCFGWSVGGDRVVGGGDRHVL